MLLLQLLMVRSCCATLAVLQLLLHISKAFLQNSSSTHMQLGIVYLQ
jgi:hypothetical protein